MLDFEKTFGASSAKTAAAASELPKALVWMNIGYTVEVTNSDGSKEEKFISLPVGIPVDTQEALPITSRSEDYNLFQDARNKLLAAVQKKASELTPGEQFMIENLEIQLRRVADPVTAPDASVANPYALDVAI